MVDRVHQANSLKLFPPLERLPARNKEAVKE
jgi:hypothetical protein